MMRQLIAAVFLACFAFVALPQAHAAVQPPSRDEIQLQILLKKKKLTDAEKVKIATLKKKVADARKKAALKLKRAEAKSAAPLKKKQVAIGRKRDCVGFMQCLFGKPRNGSVRTASLGGAAGMSNRSMRKTVKWTESKYPVGSLVVKTPERALYYVLGDGKAVRYSVGVGREGFQWSGSSSIVMKREWPEWRPPAVMIKREAEKGHILPEVMDGGPGNPLGARAMYIGGTMFRVHGTNNEASIGGAVSSGCIRMMNADVIDLYDRVKIGSKIYVYQ
jgi:lipoprotein-anchoring transpeptidase ErfK/SrfK